MTSCIITAVDESTTKSGYNAYLQIEVNKENLNMSLM